MKQLERSTVQQMVAEAQGLGRLSLPLAAYSVSDTLRAGDSTPYACQAGCALCCHQVVGATAAEWGEIQTYLGPARLAEHAQRNADKLERWAANLRRNAAAKKPLKALSDWRGKEPCPFLDASKQVCTIYPVRPLACRVVTSTKRCAIFDEPAAARFRQPWEAWLYEIATAGERILPLLSWLKEELVK